jgi:tetratricopeptide (TPR) repeat protein
MTSTAWPLTDHPPTVSVTCYTEQEDSYVSACFALDFEESVEDRDPRDIDVLRQIEELANRGQLGAAMELIESIFEQYDDFDFVYGWKAILHSKMGQLITARTTIETGLRRARSKYRLCEDMGNIEFEWGNLSEAVRWWIKSIALQRRCTRVASWHSYVYLAGIAAALGEEDSSTQLLTTVDRQRPEKIRLNGEGRNRVALRVAREGNSAMRRAIRRLCEESTAL